MINILKFMAPKKILFIVFNIIMILFLYYILIYKIGEYLSQKNDELLNISRSVEQFNQIITHKKNIEEYAQQIDSALDSGGFVTGDSEGTIKANLQKIINNRAAESHIDVKSLEVLPNSKFKSFALIGAKIVITGNYNNIYSFAKVLESNIPLLRIKQMTLHASTLSTGSEPEFGYDLDGEFHIYSMMPYIDQKIGTSDADK